MTPIEPRRPVPVFLALFFFDDSRAPSHFIPLHPASSRQIIRRMVRSGLRHPPYSLACFPTFWRSDKIGAWGAIHARRWTRRMPPARLTAKIAQNSLFAILACPSANRADILRGSVLGKDNAQK